jgi:D-arabinose 1-dehydrogenase-like Zn-dependent alcohol dehydrogenase
LVGASDKSLLHDEWAGFGFKMQDATNGIAGHEGAGEVVKVADDIADIWKVGDRAGVGSSRILVLQRIDCSKVVLIKA